MDSQGQHLQWLVRALARHAEGRAELSALYDDSAPLARDDLPALARRAAAMGLVAYHGPDSAGHTTIWLTVQGEQALGALQRTDSAE